MKGMIKFYNKDKGFGFVVNENNQEYYFNHSVIPSGKIPNSGDIVEFKVDILSGRLPNQKVPIKEMQILDKHMSKSFKKRGNNGLQHHDDRPTCPKCNRKATPRLVTLSGMPEKSLCPYCGGVIQQFMSPMGIVVRKFF